MRNGWRSGTGFALHRIDQKDTGGRFMKKINAAFLAAFAYSVLLMGCVGTSPFPVGSSLPGDDEAYPFPWEDVRIFHADDDIPEHIYLASVPFYGIGEDASNEDFYNVLKKRAAMHRANGVIITKDAPPCAENPCTTSKPLSRLADMVWRTITWNAIFEDWYTALTFSLAFPGPSKDEDGRGRAVAINFVE